MFDWLTLHVAALVALGAAFGGMAYFAMVFAPMVFRVLERPDAARFMRAMFPVYYVTTAVVLGVAALLLVPGQSYVAEISVLAAVALVFVLLRWVLLPHINRLREAGKEAAFGRLHRLSVVINLVQFVAVAVVLVRLAQ
ncbi:MAG: DUF4149 domain-containing protein [Alphaproteobacteria bacterium]|jgi:hypothetical protein|nr:DUF4149 domain-containing protein [Alphaproteobacteria bacterium]